MKRYILVLVVAVSTLFGETNDLRFVTTTTTNAQTGQVKTLDVFTRGGSTNMVRRTAMKTGKVRIQIHQFYQDGIRVADFTLLPQKTSGYTVEAGLPYRFTIEFGPSNEMKSAAIATKGGVILDAFVFTNSVFQPVESSLLRKINGVSSDVGQLFDPKRLRKATPEKFSNEVQDLILKHKRK